MNEESGTPKGSRIQKLHGRTTLQSYRIEGRFYKPMSAYLLKPSPGIRKYYRTYENFYFLQHVYAGTRRRATSGAKLRSMKSGILALLPYICDSCSAAILPHYLTPKAPYIKNSTRYEGLAC
jgi:hypothetical protein